MPCMVVVVTSEDEVVVVLVQEVSATVVAGIMVTSPTSHIIDFRHVNYVKEQITRSLSAISGLIQITWEKRRMRMQQHLME
jgi:hypothetical protein